MKKLTALAVAFITLPFILSSCFSSSLATSSIYGEKYVLSYKLLGDSAKSDMTFDDGKINMVFTINDKEVNFNLKNNTPDPMKINWDDASLIIYGESKRVMHNGVKYSERNSPQAATTIPGNSSISDLVLPSDNVYYREGYYSQYSSVPGGWETHDMFIVQNLKSTDLTTAITGQKGQTFRFFLPIEVNGQKINYNFKFEITDVQPLHPKTTTTEPVKKTKK